MTTDFKQTEIGLIPDDWETIKFESALSDNDFSRKNLLNSSEIKTKGLYPVIDQGQDYIAGYTNLAEKVYKVKEPVILFGDHTRIFKYIDFPFVGGADGIKVFSPSKDLFDPNYFYFALSHLNIPSRGYNRHYKLLKEKSMTKPPLAEQKKIAHILSKIQQAIETQEQMIKTTQELKKALMQKLFTEGLNDEPQKQTEIGLIPESWDVATIKDYGLVKSHSFSFTKIPSIDNGKKIGEKILAIKVSDMNLPGNGKIIGYSNIEFYIPKPLVGKIKAIPPNSIIFPKRGAAIATNKKRLADYYVILDPNLIAIIPAASVNPKYLFYWFLTFDLKNLQDDNPIPQLNKKDVDLVKFPLPELNTQKKIVHILDNQDFKLESQHTKYSLLKDFFKSSLNNLMTGQIRVKDIEFKLEGGIDTPNKEKLTPRFIGVTKEILK